MGRSLDVRLVYGLDLGGPESGWAIEEGNNYALRVGAWYDDDRGRLTEQAVEAYLERKEVSYERYGDDAALKSLGLEIVPYGVGEWYSYILAAHAERSSSWLAEVDPHILAQDVSDWNAKIQNFLTTLEIQATAKPAWLICADYG